MKKDNAIAITGIHTGIGKTIVSAVLTLALDADYWKPVQAGELDNSDSILVSKLTAGSHSTVHPEALRLTQPMSPHAAAAIDGVELDYTKFTWPTTKKTLLVETAGGVLSPMSNTTTMADFVQYYQLPTILVSSNYLGSINHTLLCIEVLRNRKVPILGVVTSGKPNPASEQFIEQYGKVRIIAHVPYMEELTKENIQKVASNLHLTSLNLI